ncbi:hypothetical protein ZEAMMB73_Zm00001d002701 [Zea mays]|uniref:Uncharacterized protein n=1 Tax=Zea mays TaxID=4577 RepID=A0A1D6E3K6_MAIZE|nr:hypothetical protein ZEAMMB73_Zm00001d002701 [Zea mays]
MPPPRLLLRASPSSSPRPQPPSWIRCRHCKSPTPVDAPTSFPRTRNSSRPQPPRNSRRECTDLLPPQSSNPQAPGRSSSPKSSPPSASPADGTHRRLRSRTRRTYLHTDKDGVGVSLRPLGREPALNAVWRVHMALHGAAYSWYLARSANQ